MKKLIYVVIFILLGTSSCFAQFTLNITVPASTDVCNVGGSYNGWTTNPLTYVSTSSDGTTKLFSSNSLPASFLGGKTFYVYNGPGGSFFSVNPGTYTSVATGSTSQDIVVTAWNSVSYYTFINVTVPYSVTECYFLSNQTSWTLPTGALKMTLSATNTDTKVFSYTLQSWTNSTHAFSGVFYAGLDGANGTYRQLTPWGNFTNPGTGNTLNFTVSAFSAIYNPVPSITATSYTLSGFSSIYGAASSEQSFTLSALGLTANLILTPPNEFEISTGTGVNFVSTNPITLTKNGSGNIASTTIYVRLKAGLNVNSYNSKNIACSSTGATLKNVICSGNVSQKPLIITGISGINKVIDGTTTATLSGNAALSGVLSADVSNVTLGGTCVANFTLSSVGNSLGINVSGYSISGSAIANYSLTQPVGLNANIYPVISTFSGSGISTLSNGSNITYSPLPTTDLIISSGELVIDQSATVNSVTVAPGAKLTLSSSTPLTATNGITLQSNSSGTGTLIDNYTTPTVNAIVQQYLPQGRNWYLTSPISSGTTSSLIATGAATSISYYNESTSSWVNNYTGSLTTGIGYIAVSATGSGTNNIQFSGTLNTGAVNVPLTYKGSAKKGFNLIANPYPSYLNAMTAINANPNLASTIWYRTCSTGGTYYFETVNTTSGVGTNTAGTGTVTGYVPPMQAFWVRTNLDNQTLSFTNAMRYHANPTSITTTALKVRSQVSQQLRLYVSNGTNEDEAIVYFNPNASDSFDSYDSQKMSNNTATIPEIFTVAGTEQLVINGMNSVTPNQEILLGFTTGQSNAFSIKATEVSNFDAGTQVILTDNQTNTQWNLTDGSAYNFSSDITSSNTSRFSVIFKSASIATGNINNDSESNSVLVYRNTNNLITINCLNGIVGQASASVYNAVGQKLTEQTLQHTTTVLAKSFTAGVYLVNVTAKGKTTTQKVAIN